MFRIFSVLVSLLFVASGCVSVQKYNDRIDAPIAVADLKKDVRFIKKKLFNMHPDLDWYVNTKDLAAAFDSLEHSIKKPMTQKEYYFAIAPIVARVQQGHSLIVPLSKKLTKTEKETYLGSISPLQQFKVMAENNKFYIVEDHSLDTSLVLGAELLSINGLTPQKIVDTFTGIMVGDGPNPAYVDYVFSQKIDILYNRILGRQDSIALVYKKDDVVTERKLYRSFKSDIDSVEKYRDSVQSALSNLKMQADSIAFATADSATKILLLEKDSLTQIELAKTSEPSTKIKRRYGYDEKTGEWERKLDFLDSNTALFKINSFSNIFPKPFYNELFDSLKNNNIQNLIVDLRGNPGGSLNEIHYLHSFLTPDSMYRTVHPNTITLTRTKMPFWTLRSMPIWSYPITVPFVLIDGMFYFSKTKRNEQGTFTYTMRQSKLKPANALKFSGDVYMLVDGGTFSAASITAANFKDDKRGILIGEETGGAHNGTVAGKLPTLKRKKTSVVFRVGTMNIKSHKMGGEHGRGVVPDVTIVPTVAEKLADKDAAVAYVLKTIETKQQAQKEEQKD